MQCFHTPTRGLTVSQRNLALLCPCSCTIPALQIPPALQSHSHTPFMQTLSTCTYKTHILSICVLRSCRSTAKPVSNHAFSAAESVKQAEIDRCWKGDLQPLHPSPPSPAIASLSSLPLADSLPRNAFYSQLAFRLVLFLSDAAWRQQRMHQFKRSVPSPVHVLSFIVWRKVMFEHFLSPIVSGWIFSVQWPQGIFLTAPDDVKESEQKPKVPEPLGCFFLYFGLAAYMVNSTIVLNQLLLE